MSQTQPSQEMLKRMRRAINRTYQAIGYDCWGESDPPLSEAVEVTLDADYMEMYGGDREAVDALRELDYDTQDRIAESALGF